MITGELLEGERNHYHMVCGILAQHLTYHATAFNIKGNKDLYSSNIALAQIKTDFLNLAVLTLLFLCLKDLSLLSIKASQIHKTKCCFTQKGKCQ